VTLKSPRRGADTDPATFGLLLPGCDAHEALEVVDRLRHDMPAGLTASAGIVAWSAPMTAEQLVAGADRELYRAKSDGRDRACLSTRVAPALRAR
jgi:PleD family two-component response regulator